MNILVRCVNVDGPAIEKSLLLHQTKRDMNMKQMLEVY